MPVFMKPGSPFLFDQETGDIVGVKDSDGGEQFFPTSAEVAAQAAAIAAVEGRVGVGVVQTAYIDFSSAPEGDPPSNLDSGQLVDFVFNAGGRKPVISGGKLVVNNQAGAGSGALADYYQANLSSAAVRVGCEWTQPVGSDDGNGNATYAALASVYEGGGSNVPASWCHMSIVPGTGEIGTAKFFVCNGVGNLFVVKQQTFTNPPADGVALWRCESLLDAAAGTVYSWLPDGSLMTVTNAELSAACGALSITPFTFSDVENCKVIMCEHYANTGANAAKFAEFTKLWGETKNNAAVDFKSKLQTPTESARQSAYLKSLIPASPAYKIHSPTTQLVVASTTSAANIDAANIKVSCVAGPSGKIVFDIAAYYEWSATDILFWRMAGSINTVTRSADSGAAGKKVVVYQLIEASGLTPGSTYTYTLQHWTASAGSATLKAGGSGGGMLPPVTLKATPA